MSGPLARRGFLRGLATLPLIGGSAALASSSDDNLIELGRQLAVAVAEWRAFEPEARAAHEAAGKAQEAVIKAVRQRGESLDDPPNEEALAAAWRPHMPAINRGEMLARRVEALGEAICAIPPTTVAGVSVHAEWLAWVFDEHWDVAFDDLDFQAMELRRFVETLRDASANLSPAEATAGL